VKRSDTHADQGAMGIAALHPSYEATTPHSRGAMTAERACDGGHVANAPLPTLRAG
jgi:hypothetical protein